MSANGPGVNDPVGMPEPDNGDRFGPTDRADVRALVVGSIDSAEISGLAVISRDDAGLERVLHHSARRIVTAADVEDVVAMLADFEPAVLAIESPFVHPQNPATALALARLEGRWLQAAERVGLATVRIPASLWQPAVLPGIGRWTRSADRKAAARTLVRSLFALDAGEDESDAIAMAVYVARNATRRPAAAAAAPRRIGRGS